MAFRRRTAGQRDQVGLAPVVQLPMPVGLAPVPQGPSQPLLGKSLLDPVYGRPSATSRASAHLGDAQPSSLLSRIRALAVTRAESFSLPESDDAVPPVCSVASRTAYLSRTITATPTVNTSSPGSIRLPDRFSQNFQLQD